VTNGELGTLLEGIVNVDDWFAGMIEEWTIRPSMSINWIDISPFPMGRDVSRRSPAGVNIGDGFSVATCFDSDGPALPAFVRNRHALRVPSRKVLPE